MLKQSSSNAELAAEISFTEMQIIDLEKSLPDSLKRLPGKYSWIGYNDTTKYVHYYYLTNDTPMDKKIAELNKLYFNLTKAKFKSGAIDEYIRVERTTLDRTQNATSIIGVIAFFIFILGVFKWWGLQKKLDHKLDLEIGKLESQNSAGDTEELDNLPE